MMPYIIEEEFYDEVLHQEHHIKKVPKVHFLLWISHSCTSKIQRHFQGVLYLFLVNMKKQFPKQSINSSIPAWQLQM